MTTSNPTAAAASAPTATAQAVTVTVDGKTYTITTTNTAFTDACAKQQMEMPWWGKKAVAEAFAAQLCAQLGYPNYPSSGQSPYFAFSRSQRDVAWVAWNKKRSVATAGKPAVPFFGQGSIATLAIFAVATPVPPPPAAAVPSPPAPAVAAPPAESKGVTIEVGTKKYIITTVTGSFNQHSAKLQANPWWGNIGVATNFAEQLAAQLGFPNLQLGSQGPYFAFRLTPLSVGWVSWFKQNNMDGRVLHTDREDVFPHQHGPNTAGVFAVATPIP